jgi:benzodiazapine receptor
VTAPIRRQIAGLLGWLVVSFTAAAVGAVASLQARSFYQQQLRPDWAPPATVFGPVWTLLYAAMGVAAWLVWRSADPRKRRVPLTLFIVQLLLNALWSWLFFVWHLGGLAFAEIALLWLLIAATLIAFWRVRGLAAALLFPYLLWVAFACALNYSVWQLNPHTLG